MAGAMKGLYRPKNPQKYLGNPQRIVFRSSWELKLFQWLDSTPAILQWASEEFSIPYLSPFDNKVHQYYPDALVIYKDKHGSLQKEIIEIKPLKETILQPRATERDKLAYVLNQAKWKAASIFASQQGMRFRVVTEKSMFRQGSKTAK
jgi:hypothetical protein